MNKPKVLVFAGDGINCERETARAFTMADSEVEIRMINEIVQNQSYYKEFQIFAFPGGFSFGDELGSGRILALKVKYLLQELLHAIVHRDKLAIGICNGFQALVQLGILPDIDGQRSLSITHNTDASGKGRPFINKWVHLSRGKSQCIWAQGLEKSFMLPIRHGEGRIKFLEGKEKAIFEELQSKGQIPLFYRENINGSFANIAGLCDKTGKVFGLMPHPEAAVTAAVHPYGERKGQASGMKFFQNAVQYFK